MWETTEIKHCEAKIGQNSRYEVGAWATLPLQSTVSKLVLPYPQNHRARGSYTVHSGPLSAVCLFSVATATVRSCVHVPQCHTHKSRARRPLWLVL